MKRSSLIRVGTNPSKAVVDPRVYGQNLEHFGRQIQDGLIAENGSHARQDGRGFREDVLAAVAALAPPLLRWSGGHSYHWQDGVGPFRVQTTKRVLSRHIYEILADKPYMLRKISEDNRFGTEEFIGLCQATASQACIAIGPDIVDHNEAAGWVNYIKELYGTGGVKLWSLDTPGFNVLGLLKFRPTRYVERFRRFAKAMQDADPEISLIASGLDEMLTLKGVQIILEGVAEHVSYLSLPFFMPAYSRFAPRIGDSPGHYYAIAGAGLALESYIERTVENMRRFLGRVIPIAVDKWNILGRTRRFYYPRDSLREAIGVAGVIHALHRQSEWVSLACMYAMLNSASPPIITTRDEIILTPVYHVMKLYKELSGNTLLNTEVECPAVHAPALGSLPERKNLPLLDVSATLKDKKLTLFVINRDHRSSQEAEIEIAGIRPRQTALVQTVTGSGYLARNQVKAGSLVINQASFTEHPEFHVFPPASVTAIQADLN